MYTESEHRLVDLFIEKMKVLLPALNEEAVLENKKRDVMRKTWISFKDIEDSRLWGGIKKRSVANKVKQLIESKEIESHEIDIKNGKTFIRKGAVERIRINYYPA